MKKVLSFFGKAIVIFSICVLFSLTVFAGESVDGGYWSYGGYHDPSNWGAFSNYYHPTRWHWSSVVRDSDAESNRGTASAGYTSKAFINCAVGEYVKFDSGF